MSNLNDDAKQSDIQVLQADIFKGRNAIVTGAGSGIGQGISLRLMALGMDVYGIGRRIEKLEHTAELSKDLPGEFRYESANVRETEAIEQLIKNIGDKHGINLLVNNAGGQFFALGKDISRKGWDAVIDVNLNSVFTVTRAAYEYLKKSQGTVINISLSGIDRGSKGLAHSIAARAGVLGLTRTLALEWAEDQINLNCIGPGAVLTDGLASEAAKPLLDRLVAATPMGRATSVPEVAELIAFLASPAAKLMTGQLIQIDGASHIGPGLHMI